MLMYFVDCIRKCLLRGLICSITKLVVVVLKNIVMPKFFVLSLYLGMVSTKIPSTRKRGAAKERKESHDCFLQKENGEKETIPIDFCYS